LASRIWSVETLGRAAILLALFAPPLIGVAVPLTSVVLLRQARSSVRLAVAAGTLLLWVALSIGTAFFLIWIASFAAMGWGHSGTLAPMREQIELLAIIAAGMLLLIGCGIILHRFLIRPSKVLP